ncbi:MAG: c-type cytochrome [Acidobacteriota bacterium]
MNSAGRDAEVTRRSLERSANRMWVVFALSSVVFLVVLAISPFKDYFSEYRSQQERFRKVLAVNASTRKEVEAARDFKVGIRQIWIPEWNDRVDRCTTCHLGMERADLSDVAAPFRAHPKTPHTPDEFESMGCVACHRGQGRATTESEAHGGTADWPVPMLPLAYTEASCGTCHTGDTVPEAPLLSEGRTLLSRAGCYGCHEMAGHEDWKSTAPALDGLRRKTSPGWLRAWLKDPSRRRPGTWMPDFALSSAEIEALTAFLWSRPPAPGQPELPAVDPSGGDYDRGRKLFREARCISCHTVEGKGNGSAPELMGIASAVTRRWLLAYMAAPHRFQPDTLMPKFNLTGEELLDLTAFMMEEFVDEDPPESGPAPAAAIRQVKEGERLYRQYGCGGCHKLNGFDSAMKVGPELTGIGDREVERLDFGRRRDLPRELSSWLATKIDSPRSFAEALKMPVFHLKEEQVQALVTALLSSTRERAPASYRVEEMAMTGSGPPGRFGRLVKRYRCLSCHQIGGMGGDISTAPLTAEGSKVKKDWLIRYLEVPTTIRPLLTDRMVHLHIPEDEAVFMADYMENVFLNDAIPGEIFPDGVPAERAERGRRLFHERYGCSACHMVNSSGGYNGPPLDVLGDRLRSGWVKWWLEGPQRWRSDVRCPNYGLNDQDAADLAAYVVSLEKPS